MTTLINDIQRIKALLSYGIIDTPPEAFYDDLAKLVAIICHTPIAIISFLDDKRQWYKAKIGSEDTEVPLEDTICRYTLLEEDIMEINDTMEDRRLDKNPNVHQPNGIRFYAGISLKSHEGYPIGTVCTAGIKPQQLNAAQREALRIVARQVMLHLESNRRNKDMSTELESVLRQKILMTERQLEVQEIAYNNLLNAISKSNAVVEFLPDGTILTVNEQCEHIVGYTEQELVGKKYDVLLNDYSITGDNHFWKRLVSGVAFAGTYRCVHKNGTPLWMLASFSPVLDAQGQVVRITKIAQNITNEVMARNALETLNQQKDNFIANVSHELRTPIQAIIGFSDILLESEEHPEKRKQIEAIKIASDTLLYLVNGILDLGKIEAGLFQFDKTDFELNTVIGNVFSILKLKASQKQILFTYHIDQNVPAYLSGDKHRLMQILLNLLDNALKFTLQGNVVLQVSVQKAHTADCKTTLEFRVKDTGIGIPPHKIQNIFGRFTQAEEDTTRKYGGTGLGLNICKLLVEKQGGSIDVESTEGMGSSFFFVLTFSVPEMTKIMEAKTKGTEKHHSEGRILMCEDNETIQYLTQKLMENTGWKLDIAGNGKEGIALMKKAEYDLVLMDIQMPEMDGYQATLAIRNELQSTIPIIALTAHSMIKEKGKCLSLGMNDYLSKPFDKKDLLDKISYWLHQAHESRVVTVSDPGFSLERLRELSGGDTAFEAEMLKLFINQSKESIENIKRYCQEEDEVSLANEAHKLKSSFGLIGADITTLSNLEEEPGAVNRTERVVQLEKEIKEIQTFINRTIADQL